MTLTSPQGVDARSPVRALSALAAFSLLLFVITASTFSALGVVLPAMVRTEGWSWTSAGAGFTLLGASCGLSSYLPAFLIRRIGVRGVLLCGAVVMSAGFLSLSAAHGLGLYFLGASLCGVAYQMMALIPGTHVLAAAFRRRALVFGIYFTSGSLGGVAGPLIALRALSVSGGDWRAFWRIQIAVALVTGLACAVLAGSSRWLKAVSNTTDGGSASGSNHQTGRGAASWTLRQALGSATFWVLLGAYFAHLLCGVAVASLSVAHLTEKGVSAGQAGAMLSLESLMGIVGRLLGGVLGDRLDPRYVLMAALLSLCVGAAALSVADTLPLMILYAVGSGLGFGLAALSVTVLLLDYFGREHNLEIFSATCLIGAVSALGPVIAGVIRDHTGGFGAAFQLYAAIAGMSLVAVAAMKPPQSRLGGAGALLTTAPIPAAGAPAGPDLG
jgi:MFS family permease